MPNMPSHITAIKPQHWVTCRIFAIPAHNAETANVEAYRLNSTGDGSCGHHVVIEAASRRQAAELYSQQQRQAGSRG